MRYFLLIFFYGCLSGMNILSGQCPRKDILWKRIIYLRDSSGLPLSGQQAELMPYLDKMKGCSYRNDSTHALLLQRIGALHFLQKDFVRGVQYTRQSIDIIYKNINSAAVNPRHLIKSYNNLRICYDSLKKQALRLEVMDSCIAVALRLHTGYEYALPMLYERIVGLMEAGDYYRCISYTAIADNTAKEFGYALDYRISFITWNINALIFLKRFDEAEKMVTATIDECRRAGNPKNLGALYASLATITQERGDVKKALLLYQQAFMYDERIGNRAGCAGTLNNTGFLLYFKKLRQYDMALQYYYRALQYADAGESLNILNSIGNVYVYKRSYDSALLFFQRAFDQIKPGIHEKDLLQHTGEYVTNNITEYISNLILDKADTYLAWYRQTKDKRLLNEAVRIYETTDRLFDKIKTGQNELQSKLFWRNHIHRLYENAIEACYLQNNTAGAFYFFEKSRAVLLNDQLTERKWMGEEDILRQSQVKKKIAQLERESGAVARNSPQYTAWQKELFDNKQELDRLQQVIKTTNPLYFQSFLDSSFITLDNVRQTILKDHQALVELFSGDSAVYVLVVTGQHHVLRKLNKARFDELYHSFMSTVASPDRMNRDFISFTRSAHALYRLLFENTVLPAGRIIISPGGQYFPFEALVTNDEGQPLTYFNNEHAVSYTYSARYLLNGFPGDQHASPRKFMGVAPMQYASNMNLPSLTGSDRSLQRLESYFGKVNNLVASKATKNNFLQQFNQYSIIQLYTHATDSGYNGEPVIFFADSALLLSDLIYGAKPVTRLIVLSACETGKGKLYQGEGIFSFNREFASLGIPASISDLWQVDNESTYRLTELFYKYLVKGLPADVALQKAKIEFINTGSKEDQLPYYWAAPVLAGESWTMTNRPAFPWMRAGIIAILIIVSFLIWRKLLKKKRNIHIVKTKT